MSGQIFELIPKVMADIGGVAKTRKNEQQKYSFRGIEDMYLAAHPAMVAHSVFCAPEVMERTEYRFEKMNDYGKVTTWVHVMVKVNHRFYAPDGSFVPVITCGEGLDNSDKATNKALSGAMKYALIELFCVPTEDVADSDRTTPEAGVAKPAAAPVTLVPTPPPPKEAPALPAELPEEESPYIDGKQQSYLARRFREAVKPEKQDQAEEARHAALSALGMTGHFKSKFIDENGNPTSKLILNDEYKEVGIMLMKAAKSL